MPAQAGRTLQFLWTKLPNNWTSYQPWGTRAAQRSTTWKCNLISFRFYSTCPLTCGLGNVPYRVNLFRCFKGLYCSDADWKRMQWTFYCYYQYCHVGRKDNAACVWSFFSGKMLVLWEILKKDLILTTKQSSKRWFGQNKKAAPIAYWSIISI